MTKTTKKKIGPTHRIRHDERDPYPFPNDPLEWIVVTVALTAIGIGGYVMYYLSEMS